ncbi:MAG: FecR domain-containing protein [Bacteroidota bacterium]|nr:FecR domain-containing protein [Bacteroidota bacterium]
MEKSSFDQLMERYVRGEVSPAERMKIEAWLDAIGDDDNTDLELTGEEEERIFRKLTSNLTTIEEIAALRPKRKLRPDSWIVRIAASLIILGTFSYAGWYLSAPMENELESVSKNDVEKIILNDGSLVWLRGESKVIYYEKSDENARYATFEGDALFEVSKDADRPFTIECGDARVKVLGTSFSLRATKSVVEVTVLTGKVNLSTQANADGIDVLPRDKAVYRSGTLEKRQTEESEIAALTENTEYQMQFDNSEMADVFRRLEEKFDVVVELSDPRMAKCRITIDLTDRSLDNSLRLIAEVLNFTYTNDRKTVTISGSGCD